MRHRYRGALWLLACVFSLPLSAQRPSSAIYDTEREVRFEGAVTRIDWATPNVFVFVDVRDAAGTVVNWAVQVASPADLERGGWTRGALRIGDVVAITAQPARGLQRQGLGRLVVLKASAKQLFGKDRDSTGAQTGDYMRGKGFHDPSRNPNAYPMTDETRYPSAVTVRVNGESAGRFELTDDPADHRGILSWHAQPRDHHLHEAGSYGQLLRVTVPRSAIAKGATSGTMVVRLEVDSSLPGGLAIYGARFGRYPLDPTMLLVLR